MTLPQNLTSLSDSVLLFGNGPSVLNHKWGEAVDAFDGDICRFNSFRFNDATTGRPLREYTGTRCDIWVTVDMFPAWHDLFNYKRVFYMSFCQDPEEPKFLNFKRYVPFAEKMPPEVWRGCSKDMGWTGTSSGALAAYYFQTLYKHVYIYGFDFFRASQHHYGDTVKAGTLHNRNNCEYDYFKRLIQGGKVLPFRDYLGGEFEAMPVV